MYFKHIYKDGKNNADEPIAEIDQDSAKVRIALAKLILSTLTKIVRD